MSSPIGIPLLRSAGADILIDTPTILDAKGLLNESPGPMLLEELGFLVRVTNQATNTTDYISQWAGKIEYGRYPLTNGFVPLMCMSPPYNPENEFGMSNIWSEGPLNMRYGYLAWRFAKPLFLPRGHGLSATILCSTDQRRPLPLFTASNIRMVMKGRSLPTNTRPPLQQDVPYITGFAPKYTGTLGVNGKWDHLRTTELELKNPFLNTFHVQRITARAETGGSTGDPYADVASPITQSNNQPVWTLINLTDLHGRPITRDSIAHDSLAGTYALSWTLGVDLPPREGFLMSILSDPGRNPTTDPVRLMYHIVGSRKEQLLGGCP